MNEIMDKITEKEEQLAALYRARYMAMADMKRCGMSLAEIGRQFGLTRQRVQKILVDGKEISNDQT